MNDVNLLIFGCAVSFIAVAGAYVYIRECFTTNARTNDHEAEAQTVASTKLRDVA